MSKILTDRVWYVEAKNGERTTWYTPLDFLRDFASVVHVEHYNTTSSAGDWDGILVQRLGKNKYYVIPFYQENKMGGFEVSTASNHFIFSFKPTRDDLDECINQLMWG